MTLPSFEAKHAVDFRPKNNEDLVCSKVTLPAFEAKHADDNQVFLLETTG